MIDSDLQNQETVRGPQVFHWRGGPQREGNSGLKEIKGVKQLQVSGHLENLHIGNKRKKKKYI